MNIFLYLLLSKAGDAFKIGLSTNPAIRSTMLETPVNLEGSVAFPISDGNGSKVEKTLHSLFRKENRPMPHGDGYTEWFDIEVRGDVVKFIERHRARLGVGTAIPLKNGDLTTNGGRRDHVKKRRSRQEIWDERRALTGESNL